MGFFQKQYLRAGYCYQGELGLGSSSTFANPDQHTTFFKAVDKTHPMKLLPQSICYSKKYSDE